MLPGVSAVLRDTWPDPEPMSIVGKEGNRSGLADLGGPDNNLPFPATLDPPHSRCGGQCWEKKSRPWAMPESGSGAPLACSSTEIHGMAAE